MEDDIKTRNLNEPAAQSASQIQQREKNSSIVQLVKDAVALRLAIAPATIRTDMPVTRYGIDSLAAAEIAYRLESEHGLATPFSTFIDGSSIDQIASQCRFTTQRECAPSTPQPNDLACGERSRASSGQNALWSLWKSQIAPGSYNIATALRIHTKIAPNLLNQAFLYAAERQSALHTTFYEESGELFQCIHPAPLVDIEQEVASQTEHHSLELSVKEEIAKHFDLANGPLLRVRIYALPDNSFALLLVAHHIIADFWSLTILMKEVFCRYELLSSCSAIKHKQDKAVPYTAYANWQNEMLRSEQAHMHLSYWKTQLAGFNGEPILPPHHRHPAVASPAAASRERFLGPGLLSRLKRMAEQYDATLYMTLLTIYQSLIYRLTGKSDIITGTLLNGRSKSDWSSTVGYFVNTLPMRLSVNDYSRFSDLLAQTRMNVLKSFEHQDLPFSTMVEHLQPQRNTGDKPWFDSLFVLQSAPLVDGHSLNALALGLGGVPIRIGSIDLESIAVQPLSAHYSLTVMMSEIANDLGVVIKFRKDVFTEAMIDIFMDQFSTLCEEVLEDSNLPVASYSVLRNQQVSEQLQPTIIYANEEEGEASIVELFEEQARLNSIRSAISCGPITLSYSELNNAANLLAWRLIESGLRPEDRVVVASEKGVEIVIGLLAIFKVGCAYVPIDPLDPDLRLVTILNQIKPKALLGGNAFCQRIRELVPIPIWHPVEGQNYPIDGATENPPRRANPRNLAYVIFTSGSTGVARGVCVEYCHIERYQRRIREAILFPANANFAIVSSLAADLCNTMLFPAITSGGHLHILSYEDCLSAHAVSDYFTRHKIDCLKIAPSHLQALLGARGLPGLLPRKCLVLGGERCTWDLIERLLSLKPECTIVNHYGPTETTVGVLTHTIRPELRDISPGSVPIGEPLKGVQAYILDGNMKPVATNVIGELYIGGSQVSRGYLDDPSTTALRFVPDPFSGVPGSRLYRTGDLVRHINDTLIEYVGRNDNQIKIRGYRVEMGEVEEALARHPRIVQAAVLCGQGAESEPVLSALMVVDGEGRIKASEIRQFLTTLLPRHMVPFRYYRVDSLPLTRNGKLERHKLEALAKEPLDEDSVDSAPSANSLEELIAIRLARYLGVERISSGDNFFELGGHSLMATQLVSEIQETLNLENLEIPLLALFFQDPTVSGLTSALLQGDESPQHIRKITEMLSEAPSNEDLSASLP